MNLLLHETLTFFILIKLCVIFMLQLFIYAYYFKFLNLEFFSDSIEDDQRQLLLTSLQRLVHATDTLAFPLPQGFQSFIAYLGYRVMPAFMFNQYIRCNTFSLNVDVMKAILAGE